MRTLAVGEDPHRLRPPLELVAAGSFTQQPGQLGDVRFLDPACPVSAGGQASWERRSRAVSHSQFCVPPTALVHMGCSGLILSSSFIQN